MSSLRRRLPLVVVVVGWLTPPPVTLEPGPIGAAAQVSERLLPYRDDELPNWRHVPEREARLRGRVTGRGFEDMGRPDWRRRDSCRLRRRPRDQSIQGEGDSQRGGP